MNENEKILGSNDSQNRKNKYIFSGLTFKGSPVSKEEFERHYEEYVARCSA